MSMTSQFPTILCTATLLWFVSSTFTFLDPYLLPVTKNKKIVYLPILVVSFDLYLSRSASQRLDTTDPLCHHCFWYVLTYSLASFD